MELFQDYVHAPILEESNSVLRPYQNQFYSDIQAKLFSCDRVICCAATGSGKTKVFLHLTKEYISRGYCVLILSESRKIFDQIAAEEENYTEINAGVKDAEVQHKRVYLAMAQTLIRRPQIIEQFVKTGNMLCMIIDEAHVGTSSKVIESIPNGIKLGFTATPDGRIAKHLVKLYQDIVIGPQPAELVAMGYLAKYRHFERQIVNYKDLQIRQGEFTEESQFEAFSKPMVFQGLSDDIKDRDFKKAIIYCSSIKHCDQVADDLRARGYLISVVHTGNPKADQELSQFMTQSVTICVSVGILTKGFDFPAIDLVILQRATTSLALYCQMIGRGSRIDKDIGKTHFTVLDYGGNASRHGLWDSPFNWAELWKKQKKKRDIPPTKECPKCFLMVAVSVAICPECGHKFVAKKLTEELTDSELVEVTNGIINKMLPELTPRELVQFHKINKSMANYIALCHGGQYLKEYIKLVGHHHKWVNNYDLGKYSIYKIKNEPVNKYL
jgi:superfamily II DNA or RNA helicase